MAGPISGAHRSALSPVGNPRLFSGPQRIQLRLVGDFNRWLEQKDLTTAQIDEEIIEHCWSYFMREKRVRSNDVCALMKLLIFCAKKASRPGPPSKQFRPRA